MPRYQIERGGRSGSSATRITLIVLLLVVLFGARSFATYAIEIAWWKELGQFNTWLSMLSYSVLPVLAATLLAFLVLWMAHARAVRFAGTTLREHGLYAKISTAAMLFLGYLVAAACIDTWTVVRFAGSRGLPAAATAWHDAIFGKPLAFYLFDLPFFMMIRGYVLALAIVSILVYWAVARAWQLRFRLHDLREAREVDPGIFKLEGGLESRFLRGAGVVLLLAVAVYYYLGRYLMVYNEHGSFLVGVDYVDQNIGLPMQWLLVAASLIAARRSATPEVTALSWTKWARVVWATIRASVVLPEPGGPQRMIEESRSASIALRSNVPGPTTSSCPTRSSSVRGRIRVARGAWTANWSLRRDSNISSVIVDPGGDQSPESSCDSSSSICPSNSTIICSASSRVLMPSSSMSSINSSSRSIRS